MRKTLDSIGYPQPPTTIITDISPASSIANDTIKQQWSRAIDMRYHWVRDCIVQGQFKVTWKPGKENMADYYTKHHSGAHHQRMRQQYLANCAAKATLPQNCEGVLNSTATSLESTLSSPSSRTHLPAGSAGVVRPARASQPQRYFSLKAINGLRLLETIPITLN